MSINNEDDGLESAKAVFSDFASHLNYLNYDGYLVACYSIHPLISMLSKLLPNSTPPITGIFESSVSAALSLLPHPTAKTYQKFGIVTTGKYWEKVLTEGVMDYLGCDISTGSKRFKGVETTGLSASELHTYPPEEVRKRMMDATKRLVKDGDVDVICLGCAGMAGMDAMVRAACIEELGKERGERVHIVDGVKGGIAILDGVVRGKAV